MLKTFPDIRQAIITSDCQMMQGDKLKTNSFIELFSPVRSDVVADSYNLFDFYADPGPEEDKDNFIAKVQRGDIVMLGRLQLVSLSLCKNNTAQLEYST